jgi:uncharacterized membrane protein YkvI
MKQSGGFFMLEKNYSFNIAATYIGTVIGAGFATGQELNQFFVKYGFKGAIGVILAGIIFAILGCITIKIISEEKIKNFNELFRIILGKKLGKAFYVWVIITMFIGMSVMFAGCGTIFKEQFNIPCIIGITISMLIVGGTMIAGEKGLIRFNTYLVPIVMIITLYISLYTMIAYTNTTVVDNYNIIIGRNWFKAVILYISYNIILVTVLLTSLSHKEIGEKNLIKGSIIGGICLGIIGLTMVSSMLINYKSIANLEIPMLYVAGKINRTTTYLYVFVLWLAMLTTASSNLFCLAKKFKNIFGSQLITIVILLLLSFPISMTGFRMLVATLYPFFGYAGMVIVSALLFYYLKQKVRTLWNI